jgi:hypothetical protein
MRTPMRQTNGAITDMDFLWVSLELPLLRCLRDLLFQFRRPRDSAIRELLIQIPAQNDYSIPKRAAIVPIDVNLTRTNCDGYIARFRSTRKVCRQIASRKIQYLIRFARSPETDRLHTGTRPLSKSAHAIQSGLRKSSTVEHSVSIEPFDKNIKKAQIFD